MKKVTVSLLGVILGLSSWSFVMAQQYSYGVYDYAYVDPETGGVMDYSSDDTGAEEGDYVDYTDYTDYTDYADYADDAAYYGGEDVALENTGDASVTKPILINPEILKKINGDGSEKKDDKVEITDDQKKELIDAAAKKMEEEMKNKKKDEEKNGFGDNLQNMFSEYWVQLLALVVSVIGVVLAVSGFSVANKKKQKNLKKFLHEIDDAYTSYKWKTKRCEAELYRLQDLIEDQLKEGKIDESTYELLEKRIAKYLDEIKYAEERPPQSVKEELDSNAKKLEKKIDDAVKGE